jgi:hypothetical protein
MKPEKRRSASSPKPIFLFLLFIYTKKEIINGQHTDYPDSPRNETSTGGVLSHYEPSMPPLRKGDKDCRRDVLRVDEAVLREYTQVVRPVLFIPQYVAAHVSLYLL